MKPESSQTPRRVSAYQKPLSPWVKDSPQLPILNSSEIPQDDATVKCWGWGASGQLGQGDRNNRGDGANGPCPPSPTLSLARSLSLSLSPSLSLSLPPPRLSCRPRVSSLLLLLPVCRDGDEPHFGRPGARADGRSRQRRVWTLVRSAGKAAQWKIGRRWPAE